MDTKRGINGITIWAVTAITLWGCSGKGASDSSRMMTANPASSELFDRAYGYLIKGDAEFSRLAPNYATLRPFTRDSALIIQTESEFRGEKSPSSDFQEFLHVRVTKPIPVRLIVADSNGHGLITYEFDKLENGDYTIGSKGWPVPQVNLCKGHRWVYTYVVGDQRFRTRHQFLLDEKRHFTFMAEPPAPDTALIGDRRL